MSHSISQTHSIFEQPWWLDAAAPGQWDAVEVEESGQVVARLPFVVKKRYGLRILGQPTLTQTLGPWIESASDSPQERLAREKDLFTKLISRLPKYDLFRQNFHSNVTNWLPFYWSGFTQTTHYTYALDHISDTQRILDRMSSSTRKRIQRAERSLTVTLHDDVEDVLRMATLTFQRQNLRLPYSPDLLYRLDDAATRNAKRLAISCTDDEGNVHSSAYIVGDERRAYLLVSGIDPIYRQFESGLLLQWSGIKAAAAFTKTYDFEGSMIEGIESFYRRFGATQTPYSSVTKHGRLMSRMSAAKQLISG